ncbi:MAG: hypothetical protein K1W34_01270 [Lachnospiraceae bacterium]
MTALRQSVIAKLERVPEDKLDTIIQFINRLVSEDEKKNKTWNLEQFIMPPTERGQNAEAYVRELRDNDRI